MVKLRYIGDYKSYCPGLGANEDKEVTELEAPAYLGTGQWVRLEGVPEAASTEGYNPIELYGPDEPSPEQPLPEQPGESPQPAKPTANLNPIS